MILVWCRLTDTYIDTILVVHPNSLNKDYMHRQLLLTAAAASNVLAKQASLHTFDPSRRSLQVPVSSSIYFACRDFMQLIVQFTHVIDHCLHAHQLVMIIYHNFDNIWMGSGMSCCVCMTWV